MDPDPPDIAALIADFYAVFDNRAGRMPAMSPVVFHDSAVIAKKTASGFETSSVEAFARPRIELLRSGKLVDFHEWELSAKTHVAGDLAFRRSRYTKSGTLEGAPYAGSGTKFFQLIRTGAGWRILSLAWADDE